MEFPLWYFFIPFLALLGALWRRDLRREMGWAALLALPVLVLGPLVNPHYFKTANLDHTWGLFLIGRAIVSAGCGALAAAIYKLAFRTRITPAVHPSRKLLHVLWIGPVILLAGLFGHHTVAASLSSALIIDSLLLIALRADLIWDFLFSGLAMGLLYGGLFWLTTHNLPGSAGVFWFGPVSGLTIFSLPVEELVVAFLFGALWGPLYVALRSEEEHDRPFSKYHLLPKQVISSSTLLLILGIGSWFIFSLFATPQVVQASPANVTTPVDIQAPISLSLDHALNRKKVQLSITPAVEGDWQFTTSDISRHLYTGITFQPTRSFLPDTDYIIEADHISSVLGNKETNYSFRFHTKKLPTIASSSLKENQTDVSICTPLNLTLDQPLAHQANFTFQIDPPLELGVTQQGTTFTLTPRQCLAQNQAYTLTATRQLTLYSTTSQKVTFAGTPESNFTLHFHTKAAPGISDMAPQGGAVLTSTNQLTVTFTQPMNTADPSQYLNISPALSGAWKWSDATHLAFVPSAALQYGTTYTITLKQGLPDASHGFLPADTSYNFTTIGHAHVIGLYPANGASGISASSSLAVTFDQDVDHASAESHISFSGGSTGNFTWDGNTVYLHPSLAKDTSYSFDVSAGIKSINGLDSVDGASSTFQTEESQTLLAIPVDYQDSALSCEVASLKMALNYRGAGVSETDLMNVVGYDPTPHNGNVWGNPYNAFVGNINGQQDTSGYGVYWGPIARAANNWRSAQAFSGWSAAQAAEQLAAGNPIVIWGTAGHAYYDPWQTPDGQTIAAWKGEHARLLVGFTGPASNPTSFIINDPIFGRLHWSTSQFLTNWSAFNNSGVVVY